MSREPTTEELLPLPPATLHILLALADSERHGYAIIHDVEARTAVARAELCRPSLGVRHARARFLMPGIA